MSKEKNAKKNEPKSKEPRSKEQKSKEQKSKEKKSSGQLLADKLCFNLKNCWEGVDEKAEKEIEAFARAYGELLNRGKTEREYSSAAVELLKKHGFKEMEKNGPAYKPYAPGTRLYQHIHGKALVAAVVGKKPVSDGINIVGAHVDSPRIDLKQNPLYEDTDFAYLDTHYYGGIKKYQWTAVPLAMHGLFIDSKGKEINVVIGEDEDDPVFTITDLLPHLAQDQMQKKASEVVEG